MHFSPAAPGDLRPIEALQADIPARQTICLNMIVKNEAVVIRRCLDSVRPLIDHWVIVDTGSTDGTQDIIRAHMADIPGELHQQPWRDFAHNRSEALDLARGKADFSLIIDADDTLAFPVGTRFPPLRADCYTLEISDAAVSYRRTQLVRGALPWRYVGVLHEFLTCDEAGPAEHIPGIAMQRNHDGARRKDPMTYRRDVAVLEAVLREETDPFLVSRYRFYLAQSYRDCGDHAQALRHYLARAELGYWQEEVFVSLYRAAQMKEHLGYPGDEVIGTYLRAAEALPGRSEALHAASRFCRLRQDYEAGYRLAKATTGIRAPADGLFVERWVYETGGLDELAVNAYWSGRFHECLDACLKILANRGLAEDLRQRVVANARHAARKLREAVALHPCSAPDEQADV